MLCTVATGTSKKKERPRGTQGERSWGIQEKHSAGEWWADCDTVLFYLFCYLDMSILNICFTWCVCVCVRAMYSTSYICYLLTFHPPAQPVSLCMLFPWPVTPLHNGCHDIQASSCVFLHTLKHLCFCHKGFPLLFWPHLIFVHLVKQLDRKRKQSLVNQTSAYCSLHNERCPIVLSQSRFLTSFDQFWASTSLHVAFWSVLPGLLVMLLLFTSSLWRLQMRPDANKENSFCPESEWGSKGALPPKRSEINVTNPYDQKWTEDLNQMPPGLWSEHIYD